MLLLPSAGLRLEGSVDYGGLGRMINTAIATQAQGLALSALITCSPVDCHTSRHTPLQEHTASELKITHHRRKSSVAVMLLSFGIMALSFKRLSSHTCRYSIV